MPLDGATTECWSRENSQIWVFCPSGAQQWTNPSKIWRGRVHHGYIYARMPNLSLIAQGCGCWSSPEFKIWVRLLFFTPSCRPYVLMIDWVKVFCRTRHEIDHFGHVLPCMSLGSVLKKLNPT